MQLFGFFLPEEEQVIHNIIWFKQTDRCPNIAQDYIDPGP